VKIERVPYKASPQALGDVMSGQVQLMFPDLPQGLAQIDAGKVRGLGTTGPQRTSVAPNLPAIAEAVPAIRGLLAGRVRASRHAQGHPEDAADAIAEALKDPATGKAMTQGRMEISPLPPSSSPPTQGTDDVVDDRDQSSWYRAGVNAMSKVIIERTARSKPSG